MRRSGIGVFTWGQARQYGWQGLLVLTVFLLPQVMVAFLKGPPSATYVAASVELGLAALALLLSLILLVPQQHAELRYLLSRPFSLAQVWLHRLVSGVLLLLPLFVIIGTQGLVGLVMHEDQMRVTGCQALAVYDDAGFPLHFSAPTTEAATTTQPRWKRQWDSEREPYDAFRAGGSLASCEASAVVVLPGLAWRIALVLLLGMLVFRAAFEWLVTFVAYSWKERATKPLFWIALSPALLGAAWLVHAATRFGSLMETANARPLWLYEDATALCVVFVALFVVFAVLGRRAWQRIEVLE